MAEPAEAGSGPSFWQNTGWSILGVAQTEAILGALALVQVIQNQRGTRPKVRLLGRIDGDTFQSPAPRDIIGE